MRNKLVEIPKEEWRMLRDMYRVEWPKNFVGYYTMNNYIRWIEEEPHIKHLHILSLDGDWTDGTFVVLDRYQLFLNTLSPNCSRLTMILSLIDWRNGLKVSSFLERHRSTVLDVIESKNLPKEYDSLTLLYYLPKAKALEFCVECPAGFTLKRLHEKHADRIDEIWPNRHDGSLFFIRRLIKWNDNVGAFAEDGTLAAWCLRLQAGPLGALQVEESFKRRGLGAVVVKAIAKTLADAGHDTFALVNETNEPSRRLFDSLGFKVVDRTYWLRTQSLSDFKWMD